MQDHALLTLSSALEDVSDYVHSVHGDPNDRRTSAMLVLAMASEWAADEIAGDFGEDDDLVMSLRDSVGVYIKYEGAP